MVLSQTTKVGEAVVHPTVSSGDEETGDTAGEGKDRNIIHNYLNIILTHSFHLLYSGDDTKEKAAGEGDITTSDKDTTPEAPVKVNPLWVKIATGTTILYFIVLFGYIINVFNFEKQCESTHWGEEASKWYLFIQ